jgi:phosphate propanoyltransferase
MAPSKRRYGPMGIVLVFGDVTVRIAPEFRLELHLDTDEANAASVSTGDLAVCSCRRVPRIPGRAAS